MKALSNLDFDNIFLLLEQILVMAVLMFIGYLSVRFGVLKYEDSARISSMVLYLTRIPWLIDEGGRILYVTFLASAAPTAVNVTQLANIYGKDSVLAGSINIMSVFLCIATMPMMTAVYPRVCL